MVLVKLKGAGAVSWWWHSSSPQSSVLVIITGGTVLWSSHSGHGAGFAEERDTGEKKARNINESVVTSDIVAAFYSSVIRKTND